MYDDFAGVYDTLMDDFDYDAWSAHYLALVHGVLGAQPARMAECACGTGSLTVRFAREGIAVTGVDLSGAMLRRAEEKARAWGVSCAFVRQDMRRLALTRRVDAVLATCDGVNYLTAPDDVRAFFRAAYAALKPGGALLYECGIGQGQDVAEILRKNGYRAVTVYQDTQGIDRVVAGITTGGEENGREG